MDPPEYMILMGYDNMSAYRIKILVTITWLSNIILIPHWEEGKKERIYINP